MNFNSNLISNTSTNPWDNDSLLRRWADSNFTSISCPALIISQLQRSGGTLLTQLLDGHPQLYVHPSELHIGRPNKYYWPSLNLRLNSTDMFSELWEHTTMWHSMKGYSKTQSKAETLKFLFSGCIQKEIFTLLLEKQKECNKKITQRGVLDAYITSFFNSWFDYDGLDAKKTYWVSFVARALIYKQNLNAFNFDYPDGKVLHILRDPQSWYASASKYIPSEYADVDTSMRSWCDHTNMMGENYENNDNVLIILFEDLLRHPEEVMKQLCHFLDIEYCKELLTPTFNKKPILSNSSFADTKGIISSAPLTRELNLGKRVVDTISQEAMPLYAKIKSKITVQINQ